MDGDILAELKQWLGRLIEERQYREASGELPIIEIELLNRAINEIEELRAEKSTRASASVLGDNMETTLPQCGRLVKVLAFVEMLFPRPSVEV